MAHEHRVIAISEDGYWRVKDTRTGEYLCSKEAYDQWHEYPRWGPRDAISETGWYSPFATWGPDDPELGMENGRAARMIAAFADEVMRRG